MDANGWMPIESAPKDGTHILAKLPDGHTAHVIFMRHNQWRIAWNHDKLGVWDQPKIWQHIPAFPETADGR